MKRLASVYQAEVDKRRQLIPESLTPLAQNSSDNPQLNQGLDFLNDSLGFSGEWHAYSSPEVVLFETFIQP